MREQNGKMIAIASPKQTTFFLPRISQLTYNQSPSSVPGLHNSKNRKEKSKKFKVSSLDKICLRECCKRKRQVDNINTAQVIAKKQRFMAINKHNNDSHLNNKHHPNRKNETVSRQKKRTLTYQGEIRLKNKIFVLHSLKQFEPQDIQQYYNAEMYQRETKHKVNTSQSRNKIIECKNDFIKNNMRLKNHTQQQSNNHRSQRYSKEKKEQEQDNHIIKNSYIYNDEVTKRSNHKQMAKDSGQKDDARTSPKKQYYRYIENHKKLGDQGTKNLRKATNTQYDQQKSEESLFKSQLRKENSTIFHSHKIKFGSNLKQSRIKSSRILSKDQIYKIPQTQDQKTQFLLNYKPLDPDFNLRSLVSKQNFKILDKEDKVYFGLVKGEQKHGLGILLSQKEIYEGQFMADQKFKGIQKTKQGMYFGTFVRGMREGQAKFIWKNGEEFIGEWKNGKKDGYGIWKSPKGDYYEGEWKNNKQNGKGLFVHIAGSKYNGYFKNFLKHGKGEQEFATGDKYVGQYKHGKPHGFGKYIWVNGDIYKGEFIEGSRQGKGILTKSNSESYQGSFINDMKEGQGRQSYANGDYFEGSFEQDVKIKGKLYNKKGIFLSQLK